MFDSANGSVKVVQVLVGIFRATAGIRYKLLEDIRSVKDIVVNFRCRPLLDPDAIVVVLVAVGTERLQLASLFPSQRMTEVMSRVALRIVGNCLPVVCGQQIFPLCVAIGISNAVFGQDVPVLVIGHRIDNRSVNRFGQQLPQCIVGIFRYAACAVGYLGDPLFRVVLVGNGSAVMETDFLYQRGCRLGDLLACGFMCFCDCALMVGEGAVHQTGAKLDFVKNFSAEMVERNIFRLLFILYTFRFRMSIVFVN